MAITQYELHKYIARLITVMNINGKPMDSFTFQYFTAAMDLYKGKRTQLVGINGYDQGMLRTMHNRFISEVAEQLPIMKKEANKTY